MKLCTCFLLFSLFAYTNSNPLRSPKEHKTDINLDLEGVLQVNVDKNSIIVSNKKITANNKISRRDFEPPRVKTFKGFIQEVIKILHTYDDKTFEDFFNILDKEIKKYHYKGFKYQELTEDYEIRKLLAERFDFIKGKSIREVIDIIKHKSNDKNVRQLLNYINSTYREDDRQNFQKFLTDLKVYGNSNNKEPNNDLAKIIRNGLRKIIFNHYSNLHAEEKRRLKKEIKIFLKGLSEILSASSNTNVIPSKPAVNELNYKYKNVDTDVKKPKILKKTPNVDPTSTIVQNKAKNKRREFHRKKTSDEIKETKIATSEDESDSQQLVLTFASTDEIYQESNEGHSAETSTDESSYETDQENSVQQSQEQHRKLNAPPYETLYIEDFYKTTKKPETINKSEMNSKLEKGMSIEESTDRPPTARVRHKTTARSAIKQQHFLYKRSRPSRTTSRFLINDDNDNLGAKDLRRSIAPPMPNEELSLEVFDRERRKREKALAESYSFVSNNSIQHGLKDYVKRRRNLDKTLNELKKIQEYNQRSRVNVTTYNEDKVKNAMNDFDAKGKIHKDRRESMEDVHNNEAKVDSETPSNKYEARAQTEEYENQIKETQNDINITNLFNKFEQDLENKKEPVKGHDKSAIKLKKLKGTKLSGAKNSKNAQATRTTFTTILESLTIPVFSELSRTAKEKPRNTETTSEAIIEVDNLTLNVEKEIIIKKNATTVDINEDTRRKLNLYVLTPPTRRYRRVLQYSSPPY